MAHDIGAAGDREFVEVADRCYVARYAAWNVSVGVVVGAAGAVVIDTRASLPQGREVAAQVSQLPGGPLVHWVVNTHEHFDHVLGNGAFARAAIHAHEAAAAAMVGAAERIQDLIRADGELDPDHPEITDQVLQDVIDTVPTPPTHPFSSAATIDLGDRYVELLHLGRGHTAGDLVLRVPDCDVVFAGDLIEESADREATPGFGLDCFPFEWAPTLDLLLGLLGASSRVVPGHGVVVDQDFVFKQRDDIADLAEMIRGLAAAGVPVDQALKIGEQTRRPAPLAGLAEPGGGTGPLGWPFPTEFLDGAVRRGYAQLRASAASSASPAGLPIVSQPGPVHG